MEMFQYEVTFNFSILKLDIERKKKKSHFTEKTPNKQNKTTLILVLVEK